MAKKRYTPETIIRKLREAEILQGQGQTIAQAVKQLGITEQTFYRWRKEYGGMRVDQAKRLKELEPMFADTTVTTEQGPVSGVASCLSSNSMCVTASWK